MITESLKDIARRSGAAGESWTKFTYDHSEEVCNGVDRGEVDLEDIRSAFNAGAKEYCERTWVPIWTTASDRYDFFGTFTAEGPFEWDGRQLRRALAHPDHAAHQRMRYGSGLCGDWDEDPRITETRIKWELSRERIDRVMLGFRVAAGYAWLALLSDAELNDRAEDALESLLHGFGLGWDAPRRERDRRAATKLAGDRAAVWARCRAAFPDGATLVDEGTPGIQGFFGWISGRDKDAWRNVKVEPHWSSKDDAEQARVVGEDNVYVGSLSRVAHMIEKGEMRIAGPGEHIPPRAVVARVGRPHTEIKRVEVGGRVAWVGSPSYSSDPLVLDDLGKIVRTKALREAGARVWRERFST